MKLKYILSVLLLLSSIFIDAQIRDLVKIMGNKKLIKQSTIYNMDDSIYGMIFLYSGEKVKKKRRQYEYLILDKNLNKVAKNTFVQRDAAFSTYRFYISKNIDNSLILTTNYHTTDGIYLGPIVLKTFRKINLKENKISNEFISKGKNLYAINWGKDTMIKIAHNPKTRFQIIPLQAANVFGYLSFGYAKRATNNYLIKALRFFDNQDRLQWTFTYNNDATKKNSQKINSIYIKDDMAILDIYNYNKSKIVGIDIVGVDLITGKKRFEYKLDNENSELSHKVGTIKKYEDKIYITGLYYPENKNRFEFGKKLGVYKVTLNLKGKELFKKHVAWHEISKYIDINKYAKVGKGYRLSDRDFFIFKDGSISYLSEKYKPSKDIFIYVDSKSTDMVFMNFNKDLNVKDVKVITKARTKENHYDYLFSQYINNNTGCVFFFQDYKRSKEQNDKIGVLGINKYINSKYSFEEVPIYSKKNNYRIYPAPAKEGYIILREYNKNDKYDKIRLEKINY